jgi:hypothetical protein
LAITRVGTGVTAYRKNRAMLEKAAATVDHFDAQEAAL